MKRETGIDIVKTIAILSVICVHFFLNTKFYTTNINCRNMYLQLYIRNAFIICVPLFIISTGYLQINKKITEDYFKKIIPILFVWVFYGVLVISYQNIIQKVNLSVRHSVFSIFNYTAVPYGWYVEMFIGLFLLIPFLNVLYNNLKDKKEKQLLIIVMMLLTGVAGLLKGINIKENLNFIAVPAYWVGIYPITYYFIGGYIREYKINISKLKLLYAFMLITLIETAMIIHISDRTTYADYIGDYSSILIVIQATCIFLAFYNININNKYISKIFSVVSAVTLDTYLVSFITDKIIYTKIFSKIITPNSQPEILKYFFPIVATAFLFPLIIGIIRKKFLPIEKVIQNQQHKNTSNLTKTA